MNATVLLLIGAGGGLGAIARYLLATAINQSAQSAFPFGTLAVNLLGALAIGLLAGVFEKLSLPTDLRLFLITGILGGFTTFSSFGLETAQLLEYGHVAYALAYVALTNVAGVGLVAVGWALTRGALRG